MVRFAVFPHIFQGFVDLLLGGFHTESGALGLVAGRFDVDFDAVNLLGHLNLLKLYRVPISDSDPIVDYSLIIMHGA
jgi:hypothetical protein